MSKVLRAVALAGLASTVMLNLGCAGRGRDAATRANDTKRVTNSDLLMMQDDWDTFWMVDQESRLSKYATP